MIDITRRANLGKGTIYLYFRTREEIFLVLLENSFRDWIKQITETLTASSFSMKKAISVICEHVEHHPEVLYLARALNSILGKNKDLPIR